MTDLVLQLEDPEFIMTIEPIWPMPAIFELISVSKADGTTTVSRADEVMCSKKPASQWLWENFVRLARVTNSAFDTEKNLKHHNEIVKSVFAKSIVETGGYTLGPITSAEWIHVRAIK